MRTGEFTSVLFAPGCEPQSATDSEPEYFADLNLDQIWAAISAGYEDYRLDQFFYQRLRTASEVYYRHAFLRDLEHEPIATAVDTFVATMRKVRRLLEFVDKAHERFQPPRWLASAARMYCGAVTELRAALEREAPESDAMQGLVDYLVDYLAGDAFRELEAETAALEQDFAKVRYTVHIKGLHVTVRQFEDQPNLVDEIEQLFAKFTVDSVESHMTEFGVRTVNDRIEGQVLALVARNNPTLFRHAADYLHRRRETFVDDVIARFDREVQLYLAYIRNIAPLKELGLSFCYPRVSSSDKQTEVIRGFDLALAQKLLAEHQAVVCNDFALQGVERMIVVTGPNQGGKTTFARMFGQAHHLAALGLPVPGERAQLFLPDQIFAHFEREEDLATLRSKFEDELVRLHAILHRATSQSVLVMNESLSSTSLKDAVWVGERILMSVIERDIVCACITFIDEFARLGPAVVSMMSTVDPDDVSHRTFLVVRKPADGLAYAVALAKKHGVSYEQLKERLV